MLYNYLKLPENYLLDVSSIYFGIFLYVNRELFLTNQLIEKVSYLDIVILGAMPFFVIKWNGRIDMSSFKFNDYFAFLFSSISSFVVIYKELF